MWPLDILFTTSNLEEWALSMGANMVGCPTQWAHTQALIFCKHHNVQHSLRGTALTHANANSPHHFLILLGNSDFLWQQ
jgi:hypothetical protein